MTAPAVRNYEMEQARKRAEEFRRAYPKAAALIEQEALERAVAVRERMKGVER